MLVILYKNQVMYFSLVPIYCISINEFILFYGTKKY